MKNHHNIRFGILHRTVLAGACLVWLPAYTFCAQSPIAGAHALEPVVVAAQKRAEHVQDVPISVTAVSAETLQEKGIVDTFDLKAVIPALNYSTAVGAVGLPRIRGVGSTAIGPGVENPVAVYVDGVYVSSSVGALSGLSDIEQVAVLKGPQGTLFGRNATGGVIQITTRQPSHDFKADVHATVGAYGTVGGGLNVTGGISDQIAASLAVNYEDRNDGFGVNTRTGKDIMTQESYSGRAKVRWEVENTSVALAADVARVESASAGFRPLTRNVRGNFASGGIRDTDVDVDPEANSDQTGASLDIRHQIGGMELMSLSAYRRVELNTRFDLDGTTEDEWAAVPGANAPPAGFTHGIVIRNTVVEKQFTQEIQLLSTGEGSLKWVAGAFYLKGESTYDPSRITNAFQTAGNAALSIPPGRYTDLLAKQSLDSTAAFVQGTYALSKATKLTAGLRFTRDEREASGVRQNYEATGRLVAVQAAPLGVVESLSDSFPRTTWRLSLDHRFSRDVMGFASYNRGFHSAAFAVPNIGLATPQSNKLLQPEIVDAYEVGIKSDLFDRRVRLNAAAYYYDQENAQVMQSQGGVQVINSAEGARIYGLDVDLTALATTRFTVTAAANYTHGRYTRFTNALATTPLVAGGNLLSIGDASGKRLQNVPDWAASLGASYDIATSLGDITFSANYYYNDGWVADPDSRVQQGAYGLLNGSVSWQSANDKLSLSLWGRNLADDFYFQQLGASSVADIGVQAAPRTYGVTVGVHF